MERELRQFIRFLFQIMEKRKKIFEESQVEGFVEYRKKGLTMPAIVMMIDAYMPLAETYPEIEEQLMVLVRDAARHGIYLIITAVTTRDIRYKLAANFKMTATFDLIERNYSEIMGRTEGLEPENFCGRGLVKLEKPLEFQAALPEYRKENLITETRDIVETIAAEESRRAVPIPVMPDKVDFKKLNAANDGLWIGLADSDLAQIPLNFTEHTSFIVTGNPGCGKSSVAVNWLNHLNEAKIYALDSAGAGFITIMDHKNVTDLSSIEDVSSFAGEFEEKLNQRRSELNDARKAGKDPKEILASWEQIIFAFDKFTEFTDNSDFYDLHNLMVRIIKKEQGIKVAVLALDNLDAFSEDYADASRSLKGAQTGLLLGSLKEQSFFNVMLPYGTPEKEIAFGDGYTVNKSRFAGIRAAL
jgi:S-DNA-T family DNA segregation ATPase FtsK/SpoIIIE